MATTETLPYLQREDNWSAREIATIGRVWEACGNYIAGRSIVRVKYFVQFIN